MKKKKIMIIFSFCVIILLVLLAFNFYKSNGLTSYIVKIKRVDDQYSPDRFLEVYHNNNKVEFKEVQLLNKTTICTYKNNAVYYGELDDIKEVIIVFKDKKIKAKLVKE